MRDAARGVTRHEGGRPHRRRGVGVRSAGDGRGRPDLPRHAERRLRLHPATRARRTRSADRAHAPITIGEDNEIELAYAALTFTDEARVRYRTRLAGFDRDWSDETADTKIRYTNLPAYVLHAQLHVRSEGAEREAVWSQPVAHLRVVPPLWLRWWAVLIYAACARNRAVALEPLAHAATEAQEPHARRPRASRAPRRFARRRASWKRSIASSRSSTARSCSRTFSRAFSIRG
jgi:hypothetical protein